MADAGMIVDVRDIAKLSRDLRLRVAKQDLRAAGNLTIQLVRARTTLGQDRFGQPFKPYSTKPLGIPSGATTKTAKKRLHKAGALTYYTSAHTGGLWILIQGGYAALKAARYPQDGGVVNLRASGAMLRSLGIIASDAESVTIGFSRTEEAQKAGWNAESRDFMGLTPDESARVAARVMEGVRVL